MGAQCQHSSDQCWSCCAVKPKSKWFWLFDSTDVTSRVLMYESNLDPKRFQKHKHKVHVHTPTVAQDTMHKIFFEKHLSLHWLHSIPWCVGARCCLDPLVRIICAGHVVQGAEHQISYMHIHHSHSISYIHISLTVTVTQPSGGNEWQHFLEERKNHSTDGTGFNGRRKFRSQTSDGMDR